MPPKKSNDPKPDAPGGCILQIGKHNNIVRWKEELENEVTGLYGKMGMFFTTDERYIIPFPTEANYNPAYIAPVPPLDEDEDDQELAAELHAEAVAAHQAAVAELPVVTAAALAKFRDAALDRRNKEMYNQSLNEEKLYSLIYDRMSTASQSAVRQDPEFETVRQNLDAVGLWKIIKSTHLTHIYGEDDSLKSYNIYEQLTRYNNLRQGDREPIAVFKTRFDNQVKANDGVGVAPLEEKLRAIDFLCKLDPKRYTPMLTSMRNNAVQNLPSSYPVTLAGAFRVASSWTSNGGSGPNGYEQHSAFLTDTVFVTKARDPEKGKGGKTPDEKKSKAKSSVKLTCYVCGENHYAKDCASRKLPATALLVTAHDEDDDEDDDSEVAYLTTDEIVLFSRSHVLLDNQASVNVFNNSELLTNIRESERGILLSGVQAGATGVKVNKVGTFNELGEVYYSKLANANILSFAAMIDRGASINYDGIAECFILKWPASERTYIFKRLPIAGSEGRFYVCDMGAQTEQILVSTVSENMRQFTKREVESARRAKELLARMGYPSVDNAVAMLRTGNNFDVSEYDFKVAHAIWGKCLATAAGKTHRYPVRPADIKIVPTTVQQQQILAIDIMFVEKTYSLVGVSTPLDLTLASSLINIDLMKPSRAATVVKEALVEMIAALASRNFIVQMIMSDGEGAIGKLKNQLQMLGIEVDITGAGGHVARIERRIQMIKERVRAHICGRLPFTLSFLGMSMLILYCVSRINYQPSGSRPGGSSPREIFTGQRADGTRDFRAAFGDYALCTKPTTNSSMESRVEECIVMLPTGNRTGSVKMLNLATMKIVSRDNFKIHPMPESVIRTLNGVAFKEGRNLNKQNDVFTEMRYMHSVDSSNMPTFFQPTLNQAARQEVSLPSIPSLIPSAAPSSLSDDNPSDDYSQEGTIPTAEGGVLQFDLGSGDRATEQNTQPLITEPPNPPSIFHGGIIPPVPEPDLEAALVTESTAVKLSTSAIQSIIDMLEKKRDGGLISNTSNVSVRQALITNGVEAKRVIEKELRQMLEKRVWVPVQPSKLSSTEISSIIRSSMFLKRKNFPDGRFEKYKARLVAGGDQQNKDLYDDLSSPTVSTSSVFSMLSVSAYEKRYAAVLDVGGAFLNANMTTGVNVYMRLDKTMTDILATLDKSYRSHADSNGRVVVLLKKALYGCIESAALWYENLHDTLKSLGYTRNDRDICVFNKLSEKGVQCTITVHVDDLLIMSRSKAMIAELSEGLRTRYGEITLNHGPTLNYLGMVLDFSCTGEARVTMSGYVDDVLIASGVPGVSKTPATDWLFTVREEADLAPEAVRQWFHKIVAMLLYLAKRARPDCLTAVSYLATRVTKCDIDDVGKLVRLVRYIRGTREMGLILRPGTMGVQVRLFVDASYGVHVDGRSHTGSCVVIGDVGSVHCRSTKQQIVTKSSTEAELVGLSDSANQAIHIQDFLSLQGYKLGPIVVYQDNLSCMALLERGRSGAERTRHISIRYFWVKERVDNGEMVIEHKGTKEMYANVLTKPLQGAQFQYERECLTGWPHQEAIGKKLV